MTARCEFCGSARHTLDDCELSGAKAYRAEKAQQAAHAEVYRDAVADGWRPGDSITLSPELRRKLGL